ncbi:lytic transglycosylase domain-containing protein [Salmonella enterica subsp. enterica serovar Enteritidis]|uniref:lytic transglycosylase domain-containing protein n=1 Tax=Salmonella enterica TaxID=28901 RepID=UPI0019E36B8D|nr:lytic transglycosylase domain-containing protein [Salmonella enterica]QTZ83110.1 lytic transglycosylase domain-containing protein [Salmonella phage S9-5]QXH32933.1 lytic transglycosylase domain-containing protein [Salmonella phage vB_SalP_ABTNLsp11242]MBZ3719903.1 lytic transglycosylase domain-containing protein [Salmonella enterica subsp. enterica serovar Enteritidis]HAO4783557.1 lytic transglycosylase domain-containing protein [Salmonella enterica]HAO4826965.1 lytic transglycosylase domai
MAKAWKDVIASQQYQALAPEQKAQAQDQYFNEVVAPQAGNDAEQAKQAFYAAYPPPTTQQPAQQPQGQAQAQQQGGFMSDLGDAAAETGRGLLQAGVNLANIPASMADAVASAGAWAGQKLGIGDGTYQPAPRVTTQGLEQDFGLQQGALTPQTTEGKIFSEALPYLTPVGAERIAAQAPSIAGRVAQGASRLLAENAVGSLAANSERDNPEALATDLGTGVVLGGAINQLGRVAGAAYRGVRGTIAPEAQQAIQFANAADVPLHTTDVLQPNSRVGRMAQTTAENIPFAGTSTMRANQQEARSQLVDEFASRFGEYDPSIVIGSLKSKASGIRQAAGSRIQNVESQIGNLNVQPSRAIQQIDDELANMQRLGTVSDAETISKLQAYRNELDSGNVDFRLLRDLRTQFRQDVKGERVKFMNKSEAAVNRVYNALTQDMHQAVGQSLGNETVNKLKQADAIWANEAEKLKNTRLKTVLQKGDLTPEVVNNMLFSKNKSEVQNLYRSVGQVGRAQMRNGIIGKAMEKSGGSPDQFLRQVNLMSNQTGIAFKGRDAAYLKGLKNYLESTKRAGQAGVTTPTGQQTIPFILGIGTATNPALVGAGGGYGLLARLYESEPARNAMLRLANTPRGSTAFEKALAEVERAVNSVAQGAKSDELSE